MSINRATRIASMGRIIIPITAISNSNNNNNKINRDSTLHMKKLRVGFHPIIIAGRNLNNSKLCSSKNLDSNNNTRINRNSNNNSQITIKILNQ